MGHQPKFGSYGKNRIFGPKPKFWVQKRGPTFLILTMFWPRPEKVVGPKNGQIWSKICIFGHFGPNIAIFCTFCPMPDQKPMWTRCLGGFSVMWVTNFYFSSKKKDFLPKNDQIWPKTGIFGQFGPGHAGLFSALLVGWLVVVTRGLYLARHLFTLSVWYLAYIL